MRAMPKAVYDADNDGIVDNAADFRRRIMQSDIPEIPDAEIPSKLSI